MRLSKSLHKDFSKKVRSIELIRKNFERAYNLGHLGQEDIHQAYAGLYLDLFTEFESLIEALFLGLMTSRVKHVKSTIKKRIKITPLSECESILFGGKKYLDWLPYPENTLHRAKIYFVDGQPFDFLDLSQKEKLNDFHIIRNAIAHKSNFALGKFSNLIKTKTLLPHEKAPKGYLRTVPIRSTGFTYLEFVGIELLAISNKICN